MDVTRVFDVALAGADRRSDPWSMACEKPMMALSGVRSSWLILARNSDLARLAASARSARLGGLVALTRDAVHGFMQARRLIRSIVMKISASVQPSAIKAIAVACLRQFARIAFRRSARSRPAEGPPPRADS